MNKTLERILESNKRENTEIEIAMNWKEFHKKYNLKLSREKMRERKREIFRECKHSLNKHAGDEIYKKYGYELYVIMIYEITAFGGEKRESPVM